MTTRSMAYDHPAYTVPQIFSANTVVGAAGVSQKWAAFTTMRIEAVQIGVLIASTSASQPLLYSKSGTATATTTLTALTSAAVAPINYAISSSLALAQGDQFWVTHGADATTQLAVSVEAYITAGAALTV